jgi:hypothetical protein
MKRYLAFAGNIYYPIGGIRDFLGSSDTIEEAKQLIEDRFQQEGYAKSERKEYFWSHVYDSVEGEIIESE